MGNLVASELFDICRALAQSPPGAASTRRLHEVLVLTAADGSWNDVFSYPKHNADQTVGRFPDGSNNVYVMNIPTIAKANITSSYVTETEQPYRPDPGLLAAGDANGDGEVNILDVTAIVSHLSSKTPDGFHASAADVDRDGLVTVADLKLAVRIITGQ